MRPVRAQNGGSQRAFASRDVRFRRSRNATGSPSNIVAAHPDAKISKGSRMVNTSWDELDQKRIGLPTSSLRLTIFSGLVPHL